MMEKRKVPEIRFEGFEDEWEERKLGEIVDVRSGKDYKHLAEGDIPVYGTGGYMLSVDEALSYDEDAIGIGRKGTIDNPYILRAPFWTVDTLFYAVPREKYDLNFTYDVFQNINWKEKDESTGVPSLSKATINAVEVLVSKCDEQKKIGQYFSYIDELLILHQRKYEALQNIKKSMLEKMFPRDGETVPEIRLEGFTSNWELKKLNDIVTPYQDPVPTPHNGYWRLGIRSHAKGVFHNYVQPGRELETAQMHRVAANNFIVNITFGWEHAVAITGEDDVGMLVSHRFPQFSFKPDMAPEFFKYVIANEKFRQHLELASPGGAGRNRVLNIGQMLEYAVYVPGKPEQEKIAKFFLELDHLISLQHQQLEKLKNIKSACLKGMFV